MSKKLLLHCCCAPCSIMCVSFLSSENFEFDLFWYNPNIKPEDEYNKRFECLVKFTNNENLKLIRVNPCNPWANSCELCYRARLEKTAEYAKEHGYSAFTTTLLISPYQDHEAIKRIGEEVALKYKIDFYYRDFRPFFREGQKEARARGFYMQKYCGCGKAGSKEQVASSRFHCSKSKLDNKTATAPSPQSLVPSSQNIFHRLELLTGVEGLIKLQQTRVIVFGVGGVGSWCAEALIRSGIGKIDIVDFDKVCASNINRQLQATSKTVGMSKVKILKQRLLEINPDCEITAHDKLFSKETADSFSITYFDYVIDAIDLITHKLDLIETVINAGVKSNADIMLFSSMGMALKMDPSKIKTSSIWKTDVCPLARLVRQGLRKRGFTSDFTVVYSDERRNFLTSLNCCESSFPTEDTENGKRINGSIVTVTATAGLLLANLVIQDIIK